MSSIPTTTKTWILQNYPKGVATFSSGDGNATFKLVERDIPKLGPNQVLVKTLFLSNDPAQRVGIEGSIPADRMYAPQVQLKAPMGARGLGEVVDSTTESIPKGTIVQAPLPWSEYVVVNAADASPRNPLPNGLSITHYLGALGGPGLTAYYGLVVIGEAKKGQRIVVSGAAGATGSMVVQIAKNVSLTYAPLLAFPPFQVYLPSFGEADAKHNAPKSRLSAHPKSSASQARTRNAAGSRASAPTSASTTAARHSSKTSSKPPTASWMFTSTT